MSKEIIPVYCSHEWGLSKLDFYDLLRGNWDSAYKECALCRHYWNVGNCYPPIVRIGHVDPSGMTEEK